MKELQKYISFYNLFNIYLYTHLFDLLIWIQTFQYSVKVQNSVYIVQNEQHENSFFFFFDEKEM